ncbi:MAG: 1-phosphofructokinase [Proteobacteria bacterium]|nr:1-phosphofructokinase [Pseudomonadota bacterium]MBU1715372.1 1-phosphofructokinase [Pseudomonadota bacterium]
MIYTVTLNTALDRTLWIKNIHGDDCNRIEEEKRFAGGKGVDISKVLTNLGIASKALGFVGGFAGDELEGLLINEGVPCDFIRISGDTRTNIILNDLTTGEQTIFNARGPQIKPYELMQLIHKIEALERPEIVSISGSLPPGVNPEIYRKIVEIAKSKGAKTIIDTDGEALKAGLQAVPYLIKPNIHELSRLVDKDLKGIEEISEAAAAIVKDGVAIVLVSMGADGILLVSEKENYLATPPKIEVKNTIGAGDSAIAGFIYGLTRGESLQESLRCAVAAGTATTSRPGTALCQKDDFAKLLPLVTSKLI